MDFWCWWYSGDHLNSMGYALEQPFPYLFGLIYDIAGRFAANNWWPRDEV